MAPKRKRADDSAAGSTRATRSSMRNKAAAAGTAADTDIVQGLASAPVDVDEAIAAEESSSEPRPKARAPGAGRTVQTATISNGSVGSPLPAQGSSSEPKKKARASGTGRTMQTAAISAGDDVLTSAQDSQPKNTKQKKKHTPESGSLRTVKPTKSTGTLPSVRAKGGSHNSAEGQPPQVVLPNASNASLASTAQDTKTTAKPASEPQPYTADHATALFSRYADPEDPSAIGPEGLERLCNDADIPLDGALPLILAWQFGGSEMARFTKDEWAKGTSELQVAHLPTLKAALRDLDDLLILNKTPLAAPTAPPAKKKSTPEPYNRSRYYAYAADKPKAFNELYTFCFTLAKPPQARNIDIDTATAFWSVLVAPRYPMMQEFLQFVSEKGAYKGVNKDIWAMALEFCQIISPTLDNYEDDGAWPTIFDEFVSWKKSKQSSN